jgi:hypothetical protein
LLKKPSRLKVKKIKLISITSLKRKGIIKEEEDEEERERKEEVKGDEVLKITLKT